MLFGTDNFNAVVGVVRQLASQARPAEHTDAATEFTQFFRDGRHQRHPFLAGPAFHQHGYFYWHNAFSLN
jgi:hypothetical protein